jgi:hypothetical protein
MSCGPGQVLVFNNVASLVGASCNLAAATCSCADSPPVPVGDWGRDSRIAVLSGGKPVVSAYNKTYGDLVLARYDTTGTLQSLEAVDGVPAGATPVGRPSGFRGGIDTPGPDVGRYTSVAVDAAGNPIIAYYDLDNGDLKFAALDSGRWVTHTVDATGDVGRYAHLVVGPGGIPAIAYFMLDSGMNDRRRGLKFAQATKQSPRAATDWHTMLVDSLVVPAPPPPVCGGCPAGQVCLAGGDGGANACAMPDNPPMCMPACPASKTCVGGVCRDTLTDPPVFADLPAGVGLFPSLAFNGNGVAHIAYYDRSNGDLKGAKAANPTPRDTIDWHAVVVDGTAMTFVDGDVGLFPSLAFNPRDGKISIAYEDAVSADLVFYSGADFTGGSREVVDSGAMSAPLSLVGANASLAFAPDGTAFIAYQDATYNDLKLARRTGPGTWQLSTLLTDGAWGFFADLAISGGKLYISNLKFGFDENAMPADEVRVLIQNLP